MVDPPPGPSSPLPTFPGGALVGLVFTLNLTAALIKRFDRNWSKLGLWIIHAGLILLVAGEFCTGAFQQEMSMAIEEGQTVNYVEAYRDMELVGHGRDGSLQGRGIRRAGRRAGEDFLRVPPRDSPRPEGEGLHGQCGAEAPGPRRPPLPRPPRGWAPP